MIPFNLIYTGTLHGVGECMFFGIIRAGFAPVDPYPLIHTSLGCLSGLKRQSFFLSCLGIIARAVLEVRLGSECWTMLVLHIVEAIGRLRCNILS
jgi:hypothetical protein